MIILIGGEKGGAGKSCLAQNLAVYLQIKNRDILLLDADPQGTTTDWIKERDENEDLKNIPSVQASGNIRQVLKDLSKRYEDIVIDAGGQDSEALRSAMTIATHMLLPFRPKRRDLKTLDHMEQILKLAQAVNPNLNARAIITQCPTLPSQVQRILDAKEACVSFGIKALDQITTNRNVYDDADENGLSVFEVTSDLKAKAEIEGIAQEFLGV
ncbi:AAA family ATPase [Acinetobacter baumannii]|jgi:chromosome partitioning protein|uniref:AAA family ATPase n=1 Tax=Acinetobacter TaxID=469 RepID=UPI0015D24F5D|nr:MULTISPECIES: AAA family ATPase [Acinetobacter]MDV5203823.1 AAA family ATPase [Acinetobacter baumannii]MDV5211893.1 AAA family ATPase [Acinetobacter baumannii]MDV5263200.1 AAA family ATPase [Acinetobacter baumannii]MDV5263316.1 AAA family ATPase [Acinetobacter baumannii]MDV5275426.1 AAA family ATPase [Acinetobacter baumannii]